MLIYPKNPMKTFLFKKADSQSRDLRLSNPRISYIRRGVRCGSTADCPGPGRQRAFQTWWQHGNSALADMTKFPDRGRQLKKLREDRGFSAGDMGRDLTIQETTSANLETGRYFKAGDLKRFLGYFNCCQNIVPNHAGASRLCSEARASYRCGEFLPGMESWWNQGQFGGTKTQDSAHSLVPGADTRPTCLEICAGAGGQALGLELAGFRHVALVEYEEDYCEALRRNRPGWNVICKDVREFSGKSFAGKVDLLAGGVPCPPFSKAGRQLGHEDERDLFPEAIRLIGEIKPRAVMLENVRGFLDPVFDDYRNDILQKIAEQGYQVSMKLLNASDYGVPQLRPRVVIVGIRNDLGKDFSYPHRHPESAPTVASAIFDLMAENGWKAAGQWAVNARRIAPTVVGGSKKHGGPDLGPVRARRAWAELGIDGLGVASEAPPQDFQGMPRLTPRMLARIQGFPDSWTFAQGKTKACRMIGNAFPPPVAMAVGREILKTLETP